MSSCSEFLQQVPSSSVNEAFAAVGFVLGLLIGFIVCFLLLWICYFHRKFISKHYNVLCLSRIRWSRAEICCREKILSKAKQHLKRKKAAVDAEEQLIDDGGSRRRLSSAASQGSPRRRRRSTATIDGDADVGRNAADDTTGGLGVFCRVAVSDSGAGAGGDQQVAAMIDVITQTTEYGGELQLAQQDYTATEQLERDLVRQRLSAFGQLCWLLLNSLAKEKLLDVESAERLRRQQMDSLRRLKLLLDDEQRQRLKEIEEDRRLDDEQRAAAAAAANSRYGSQLAERLSSSLDRLARDVGRSAKLSEQQLDELMQSFKADAAKLEERLQRHRLQQSNALEEALARRRLLLAEQKAADESVAYDAELRLESRSEQLQQLQKDKVISDSQKLLNNYRLGLLKCKEAFEKDYIAQQQTLAIRLRQLRAKQEAETQQQYSLEASRLTEAVEAGTMTDADAFLAEYFGLLEEHSSRRQRLAEQLDDKECNQLALLRDDLSQEKRNGESATEEALGKRLAMQEEDWGRLLDAHRNQTEKLRRRRRQQQQQQLQQLEEKLSQRQSQLTDSLSDRESELLAMEKRQEVVLKKSLAFQLDVDDAYKKRILEEHHRSMLALGNSLQVSRLKQEKRLEAKVAARKAQIGEARRQGRDAQLAAADERQSERARADAQRKEEELRRLLEEESRSGRRRLRDELAKETEEALRCQEAQLGGVIAKLQTGRARRKGVIDKQQLVLNDLQSQLEARVAGKSTNPSELDQILHSHRNQVASLSEQMQRERRQQEQQLAERLQRRQMEKEEEVKDSVDKEERDASKALDESGHGQHGRIAQFALEMSLDAKFRNSMMQMEEEMRLELKRQQEELDREMEADLQSALEDKRKQLLSQLARVTSISQSEMKQMVEQAGESTGAGRRLTRQVSSDIVQTVRQLDGDEFDSDPRRPTKRRSSKRYQMDDYTD